jgi:hypothetical protein
MKRTKSNRTSRYIVEAIGRSIPKLITGAALSIVLASNAGARPAPPPPSPPPPPPPRLSAVEISPKLIGMEGLLVIAGMTFVFIRRRRRMAIR